MPRNLKIWSRFSRVDTGQKKKKTKNEKANWKKKDKNASSRPKEGKWLNLIREGKVRYGTAGEVEQRQKNGIRLFGNL